jgi:hypothetical protein
VTWVIGASSIFGYGAMISDVRVTFSDGREADLVQKAYGLGPFIVGGFAGSINIGFQMLESLSRLLVVPADAPQPGAWEPDTVAESWQPTAAKIFAAADKREQAGQSHIMLVGISHEIDAKTVHLPNVVQGPRAFIIRMVSPNFEPEITRQKLSVGHIGSGSAVLRYTELMKSHFDVGSDTLKAEMGAPGMWPRMLGHSVMRVVEDHPVDGISPHVHILVCRSGEIFMMHNDSRKFPPGDAEPIEFKMPPVARSYAEFLSMCRADGIAAEGAVA